MLPLLLSLRQANFKNISIAVLLVAVFSALSYIRIQTIERQKAELVYKYPRSSNKTKIVKVIGPVRVVTRIIEKPTGEKETTIEESHDPITETTKEETESSPVPLSIAMAPVRADRYLLSLGLNKLSADFDGKALFVGYGFKNRLDVQVGGIEKDGFSPWVLTTFRF